MELDSGSPFFPRELVALAATDKSSVDCVAKEMPALAASLPKRVTSSFFSKGAGEWSFILEFSATETWLYSSLCAPPRARHKFP